MIRAFLAVPAGEEVRRVYERSYSRWVSELQGLTWVAADRLHLTLRFLGDARESDLDRLQAAVAARLDGLPAIRARLGAPGAFGSAVAPRTLWMSVAEGAPALEDLARRVESAVREHGFPPERKPWRAHLTLARNRRGVRVPGWRQALAGGGLEGLSLDVDGVSLLSSTLLPSGPIYTEVWKVSLAAIRSDP